MSSDPALPSDAASDLAAFARAQLAAHGVGTLCTTSVAEGVEGIAYGSVVPYALTAEGEPLLLLADIASHTANLRADPRGSLFVREPSHEADPQAGWRLTVMGTWTRVPADHPQAEAWHARYRQRVPSAPTYQATHRFGLWRLASIARTRCIAGFGRIGWVEGADMAVDPGAAGVADAAPGAIAHMNADHADSLIEMCTGLHGFTPASATMTALDRGGFLVRTQGPDRLVYFPFDAPTDAQGIRHAVVGVLRAARSRA